MVTGNSYSATTPVARARIEQLRRIFLGPLPGSVESALQDVRRYSLSGSQLLARLEALRHRLRLNPPEDEDTGMRPDPEIVRIVCSDALIGLDS